MGSATVIAVCSKATPGVGKTPRDEITLVPDHGVEGDYHAGAFVRHRSRAAKDPRQPNLRQVHLMHAELFDELAPLGIAVTPGAMGENITTRGLPILDLAPGTRLHLGATAVIEVTGCRNPCNQLDAVDERLLAQVALKDGDGGIIRKAGVMAIVIAGGAVGPGDAIRVETPAGATGRLQPV
jgi:MOSC domain-containing protein YiiM